MENQCCLCGEEGTEIGEGVYACEDCILDCVRWEYGKRNRQPWYKAKFKHWGFYVLVIGFLAYLVTWFVIKPLLEKGGGG